MYTVHLVKIKPPFRRVTMCFIATFTGLRNVPGFQVPSDSIFPPQLRSSSRALPFHLHVNNCLDVFSLISSLDVPEPDQPSPSLSVPPLLLPMSPNFRGVLSGSPHCPSHHSHLCCCHALFIFNIHWPCVAAVKQRRSNQCPLYQ